jgi:hypothetical protein
VSLFLVSITAALLLAELVLRICPPDLIAYRNVRVPDPVLHHKLNPSSSYIHRSPDFTVEVKTNSLGMRDSEYVPSAGPECRLLILGDSFTEGFGVPVESCFVQMLERKLNAGEAAPVKAKVFNAGVAGYSPLLEFLYLREHGMSLSPHVVVMCYDMNDVQEDALYTQTATFDSVGAPVKVSPSAESSGRVGLFPNGKLKKFLNLYSYVYLTLRTFLGTVVDLPGFDPNDIRANHFIHTLDSAGHRWDPDFERSQRYIELAFNLCRAHGIPFLLTVHPRGHQVSPLEWTKGRKYWKLESTEYNSVIFRSLRSFALRKGIPYLDMTDALRQASHGDLYFPWDGHWTVKGHRVAADTLFQFITSRMWPLPSGAPLGKPGNLH